MPFRETSDPPMIYHFGAATPPGRKKTMTRVMDTVNISIE